MTEENETPQFGWCDLHGDTVGESTYEWKGCWGCFHFSEGEGFPYLSVAEVALALKVSESTVRRWAKEGKIEGRIFKQGRRTGILPSPRKYHITWQSVSKLVNKGVNNHE